MSDLNEESFAAELQKIFLEETQESLDDTEAALSRWKSIQTMLLK